MSLTRRFCVSALRRIVSMARRSVSSSSSRDWRTSDQPRIAVSGVRSSWESVAKNRVVRSFASSFACLLLVQHLRRRYLDHLSERGDALPLAVRKSAQERLHRWCVGVCAMRHVAAGGGGDFPVYSVIVR
jgi:hypothetical protein